MANVQLYAYLGVNEDKRFTLHVSAQQLNPIGTRLERGSKFPMTVYDHMEDQINPEKALEALRAVQRYLNKEEEQLYRPEFGHPLKKRRKV